MNKISRDRVAAVLSGIAIGDAAGADVEGLPSSVIIDGQTVQLAAAWELFPDPVKIADTLSLKKRIWKDATLAGVDPSWAGFIPDREPFKTTDDEFLNGVVTKTLYRSPRAGWDNYRQVVAHIIALHERPDAWGPTVKAGIEELRDSKREIGHPAKRGKPNSGIGNGPAMRSASLGILSALEGSTKAEGLKFWCFELGLMTHWDIRASVAAFAYARYLDMLLRRPMMLSYDNAHNLLGVLAIEVEQVEKLGLQYFPDNQPIGDSVTISGRLRQLFSANPQSYEDVAKLWGTEGSSLVTVPYVLGMMLQVLLNGDKPYQSIMAAVHAGGDTDTSAALLGALLGACFGRDAFPREWLEYPTIKAEMLAARQMADKLYFAARY